MKSISSYILGTIKENGNLFTIFAAVLVIFTGIAIVDNRSNWWMSGVAIAIFFFVVFIFMNARVVIKSTASIMMSLFMSVMAFQFGTMYDPVASAGFVWMFQILFSFFAMISISYLFQSYKSRWGTSSIALATGFITTSALMISGIESITSIIIGTVITLSLFVYSYILTVKWLEGFISFKKDAMPENYKTADILQKLQKAIEKENTIEDYDGISRIVSLGDTLSEKKAEKLKAKQLKQVTRSLKKDKLPANERNIQAKMPEEDSAILAYGKFAYLIRPIDMKTYFMEKGRKNRRLTYRNKNISSWLLSKYYNEIPTWKTGNAPIMMILLDVNNSNGKEVKVIGVSLPDSIKKMPIAVIPAKGIEHNDRKLKTARDIISSINSLDKYHEEILPKEKELLDLIGTKE